GRSRGQRHRSALSPRALLYPKSKHPRLALRVRWRGVNARLRLRRLARLRLGRGVEAGEGGGVQAAVAADGVAAGRRGRAVEVGEAAASLLDQHLERRDVPELDARLQPQLGAAVQQERAGVEVAVG